MEAIKRTRPRPAGVEAQADRKSYKSLLLDYCFMVSEQIAKHNAVAPGALGIVKSAIGFTDKRRWPLDIMLSGHVDRDTNGCGYTQLGALVGHVYFRFHCPAEAFHDDSCVTRIGAGQQHHKLFTPVAGDTVAFPQAALEHPRRLRKDLITDLVPVFVIHLLEMVEIEKTDHQRPVVLCRECVLRLKALVEVPSVVDAGQTVAMRRLA